jgi:signal transduction histidine kinase
VNRWREACERCQEGLVFIQEGRVVYLNPAAAEMLGVARESAEGKPLTFVLRHHRLLELADSGGEAEVGIFGKRLHVRVRDGVVFLRDVGELESRREELEAERRLLAHEFRTPVAGLAGLIEFLEQEPPQAERLKALALMRDEANRLLRLAAGQGLASPRPWSPLELRERLTRFIPGAAAIEWRVEHQTTVGRDPIYKVLVNLVENALNYGEPPVVVRSRLLSEGMMALEVLDSGPELADYERLFEPGSRGVHAAGVRGSGLGLALVRRIARSWGGEAYGRRVVEGNVFGVTMPVEGGE